VVENAPIITARDVATWLRQHPTFLKHFPDLVQTLVVPRENGASTSLVGYQLEIFREKNQELSHQLNELLANAKDNEQLALRTHQLTLTLLRQRSAAGTWRAMVATLKEDFSNDLIRIISLQAVPGLQSVPWLQVIDAKDKRLASFHDCLAQGEPVCGRLQPEKNDVLYGALSSQVLSSALLPLPDIGLVAIGSFDGNRFYPGMGTLFLRMMGESLSVALQRFAAPT